MLLKIVMKFLFDKIWNFDFYTNSRLKISSTLLAVIVIIVAIGYPLVEVLLAVGNASSSINIFKYIETVKAGNKFSFTYQNFEQASPHIWISIALLCVVARIISIVHSYHLSKKELGKEYFEKLFLAGTAAFLVGALSGAFILGLMSGLSKLAGVGVQWEGNPIIYSVDSIGKLVNTHVPSVLNIQYYWLAFTLTIFLKGLPGYFIHWLSHKSRLLWLVTHRSHHMWEYLYPTANAPAFSFDFLLHLPSALLGIVISKMIYTEPLVMEMILWSTVAYSFEVFNHSIAHYEFCYKNPLVRNASRLFGDLGVYHLVHHSAYLQDQNVNFGGTPFNFWDRIFGTYRKPYTTAPSVGLTDKPPVSHNPFRIIYNGIAQLFYEWRMNKDWSTRFKIIFGDVYYKPPHTKDYLILS
jgi:sterol desaturase/sphingolipid hydroxylase (fatty acid hydroxylase superfamily)